MEQKSFTIGNIPALLIGSENDKAYLFIHGKCGNKEEAKPFAELACPCGYQVISIDLPEHGERANEKNAFNPSTVVPELIDVLKFMKNKWKHIFIRANSIGAYFSMLAFNGAEIEKALFVSPILDMEKLIQDMMLYENISMEELEKKREILTASGEIISLNYFQYVKEHPIHNWECPIAVLYAEHDNMTSRKTADAFVASRNAVMTFAKDCEHWFHTPAQFKLLADWEKASL